MGIPWGLPHKNSKNKQGHRELFEPPSKGRETPPQQADNGLLGHLLTIASGRRTILKPGLSLRFARPSMGKVIEIKNAQQSQGTPRIGGLSEDFIEESYRRLAASGGFTQRKGQKELSVAVRDALVLGMPLAAEAPTGTGKTIAYLIGALAAAKKLERNKPLPVVIATATVGLQNQIMQGDLPRLVKAGILEESSASVAKGRGRYFCPFTAEKLLDEEDEGPQTSLFETASNARGTLIDEVKKVNNLWTSGGWAGDLDSLPLRAPTLWDSVKASSHTCIGSKCAYFEACPFMQSRRAMSTSKVIVANHDLVLADLGMTAQGLDPVLPVSYLLVFDEAHHLPEKAIGAGAAAVRVKEVRKALELLPAYSRAWSLEAEFVKILSKAHVHVADFNPEGVFRALERLETAVLAIRPTSEEGEPEISQLRFPRGVVEANTLSALKACLAPAENVLEAVKKAAFALRSSNVLQKKPTLAPSFIGLLSLSAALQSALSELLQGLDKATSENFMVRWAEYLEDDQVEIHSSPLQGSEVLRPLLWESERVQAVLVSATLQDTDGFKSFQDHVGLDDMLTLELEPIFDYQKSRLGVVTTKATPSFDGRPDFEQEVASLLPSFINPEEGTLVLFPSKKFMTLALKPLREAFGPKVLAQGEKGSKELIRAHKTRVDSGLGSILCGLATLAEGLDLPGDECTHVIICALPFSAPTSPVEVELKELLGDDYFRHKAMPEAFVKLVQMVGRLIRRESDSGTITVFDRRLLTTGWGRKLLHALPPFRRYQVRPERAQDWIAGKAPNTGKAQSPLETEIAA